MKSCSSSKGLHYIWACSFPCTAADAGDSRRRLGWQGEVELLQEDLLIDVGFGVAAQDQGAAIGGGEMHIEHLDGGELLEHGARRESRRQWLEPRAQRDVQAIGHEGDKDVGLDAAFELVVDRAQLQIVLQVLERRLDLGELDVELPEFCGIAPAQIGAQ